VNAAVLTVSDRVARGDARDGSGDLLEERLRADGYEVERLVVPDEADRIAAACGTDTADEAVAQARAGDARARAGLAEVGRYLGIGIANMITVISPDRVVIGGGVSAAADLLLGPIREEVRRRVHTTSLDEIEIVTAELGTWAGAIGAAIHGAEAAEAAEGSGATISAGGVA